MSGKPSADMERVMSLIRNGMKPYDAAHQVGVHPSSIYRSRLYKAMRAEMIKSKESQNKG